MLPNAILHNLLLKARSSLGYLRLRPYDQSTPQGRSAERHRRIAITAASGVAAKVVNVVALLVSVPLTLHYLGPERYGLWLTISAVIAMLSFADLGIGNGLISAIAESAGRGDTERARGYVSSAVAILTAVAIALAAGFAVAYPLVDWAGVFNVHGDFAAAEASRAMLAFMLCFLVGIPLGIVQRVQLGCQEGFHANAWQAGGYLLGLGALLIAIHLQLGLFWLVIAVTSAPIVVNVAAAVVVFGFQHRALRPRLNAFSADAARRVMQTGLLFFVLQIAGAVLFQSASLVIARVQSPESVPEYGVPYRLFFITPMLLSFFLNPLWPAYGEAIARGDTGWVRATLRRSLSISTLAAAIPLAMILVGPAVLRAWVGPEVFVPRGMFVALAVWTALMCIGSALAMFLNGVNVVGLQVVCAILSAALSLPLSILLTRHIGTPGAVWGTAIGWGACTLVPCLLYVPRLLRRIETAHPASPAQMQAAAAALSQEQEPVVP